MLDTVLQIASGVLVPVVLAIASWLGRLHNQVTNLRVHIAEQYVNRELMRSTFEPLRDDVEYLKSMLVRIADKLHVDTRE